MQNYNHQVRNPELAASATWSPHFNPMLLTVRTNGKRNSHANQKTSEQWYSPVGSNRSEFPLLCFTAKMRSID